MPKPSETATWTCPFRRKTKPFVRGFLSEHLPTAYANKVANGQLLEKSELETWHSILHKRSWLAYDWLKEFGGPGWSPVETHIFKQELAYADAPKVLAFNFKMLAPVLMTFGTREQCDYWLPRMLDGTDWSCQGYSELGTGLIWHHCAPRSFVMGMTTSSTDKKPGPRSASTRT